MLLVVVLAVSATRPTRSDLGGAARGPGIGGLSKDGQRDAIAVRLDRCLAAGIVAFADIVASACTASRRTTTATAHQIGKIQFFQMIC